MTLRLGNTLIAGSGGTVDQTYDGTSTNAQSGIAVAEALATISLRDIGEIIQSTIPLTDAGLHLLDGSLISGSGSYADFVTYISGLVSTYPDIFETEANWQTSVTNYGVCGKFVYDSVNNTVRLPKITGFTEGTIIPSVLGDLTQAGLPNITNGNDLPYVQTGNSATDPTGTGNGLYIRAATKDGISTSGSVSYRASFAFDASRSSSIYGNSTTVQPQSIKVLYYIVIATSTKTEIEVDIDEIATDLNGKADVDLSNLNSTGQKVLDGQWVESLNIIANGESAPTSTNKEYDLSTYLPNDGYKYEILVSGWGTSGTSSGNRISIRVTSDIITLANAIWLCRTITRTSSSAMCAGTATIPIGSSRLLKVMADSTNSGTFTIISLGYRRIGTNQ